MVANKEKTPKQQQLKRAQNINIKECLLGFFVGINLILWTICSIKTYECVNVFESCGTNTSIFLLGMQKFLNYYNIAEVKFLRIQYVYIKELLTYNLYKQLMIIPERYQGSASLNATLTAYVSLVLQLQTRCFYFTGFQA